MERSEIDALRKRVDIVSVVGSYLQLKKSGKEFVGLCPFHNDQSPSLWVIAEKGFAHCFSCGWSGDVIDFVKEIEGITFPEACERLGHEQKWVPKIRTHIPPTPERITGKPPADAGMPNMFMSNLGGEPSRYWVYKDEAGETLQVCARYDIGQNGSSRKEIRMWTWGARGDAPMAWECGHANKPRPLYGLDRLAARPDDPVIICEGEKSADAAGELLPQYVPVSWSAGANAWDKHNLLPLSGRRILLWPDADDPGIKAMRAIGNILSDPNGLNCSVKLIQPDDSKVKGWDAADALAEGWTVAQTVDWAKPRIRVLTHAEIRVNNATTSTSEPPTGDFVAEDAPRQQQPPRNPPSAPTDDSDDACPMSEDDLAEHYAKQYAGKLCYIKKWGVWMEWRGDGWYEDETNVATHYAVQLCRSALYWPEASQWTPNQKRSLGKKVTAWSMKDIASTHPLLTGRTDQWDKNKRLIGIPGGVIDLRLGQPTPPDPKDYITKRTAVAPAPGAPEVWLKFLNTVLAGDQEMIAFMKRFAGYCMTGETVEQCLVFLYGTGQNGKGVFITTLAEVLGDYVRTCSADVFMATDQNRHPTERARLRGARLVTVDETDSAQRWNEALVKRITGGGKIEAHFMRQDDFEFYPEFKLLVAGNHKPQMRGVGKAMQRRFHLVPFTVTIPDEEKDINLQDKLRAEYPQILNWMLEGCKEWSIQGLGAPQVVRDATALYVQGEDTIGEWLEENTTQSGSVARPIAYKNYKQWMDGRGERAWSSRAWWAAMEERGYAMRKSMGQIFVDKITLKTTESRDIERSYYDT